MLLLMKRTFISAIINYAMTSGSSVDTKFGIFCSNTINQNVQLISKAITIKSTASDT